MKTTVALGTATRTMGKLFFALMLLLAAVAVGFGGTALFVYHQFGASGHLATQSARGIVLERRSPVSPAKIGTDEGTQNRRVAASSSDRSVYTYADNNGGLPSAPAKRVHETAGVPAPLAPSAQSANPVDEASRLNDPESHYIVDACTGRVIGIDGSSGARREDEQQRLQSLQTAPRAIAVQTPPPEVRVAAPVIEDGQPIYHGMPASTVGAAGARYLPVRKASPVIADDSSSAPSAFSATAYLMRDQDRPVLRAQPVASTGARVVKSVRVYRLPDGSQAVAAD